MAHVVGSKGQIVIAKEIRDKLGVKPGWISLQRVIDDHVEVYFLPPEHHESLMGCLTDYTSVRIDPGEEWDQARERGWTSTVHDRAAQQQPAS